MTCCKNIVTRLKIASILIVLMGGFVPAALGQTATKTDAERSESTSGIQFSLDANSHAGTYTYVPGEWGELHLRLENGEDAAQDLLCTSYFGQNSTVQFARQVWLPAHSRLKVSHPILFPNADQLDDRSASVRSLVIEASPGNEVLVRNDSGQLQHERSLLITPPGRNTGVVVGWTSTDDVPKDVLDLIIANRAYQGLDHKVTLLADQFLPADETSLNYLDHLILAENRLVDDFAGLTAVRRWLHGGGRLWIMLDRTDPIILERLFGDEFQGAVVDRVELTSVRVDQSPTVSIPDGIIGETFEFDEPVEMAQVVVSDMEVLNTVNGWPAAMTRTYGRGRVLITTLGPRGWMKTAPPPVIPSKKNSPPPPPGPEFAPLPPMENLAPWVLAEREPESLPQEALESFAKEYVSYKVPTWTLIIGTMGAFLATLVATGSWFWKRELPEHFGWSGSLLAFIFGAVFVGIGVANRYGVPETISSVYFAEAIGGTDDVRANGVMAVYRPGGGQSLIRTSRGGELRPDMNAAESSTARMVTTDLGTYQWDGLSQPAGLGVYPAETSRSLADRIAARATIDAQGVSGVYKGPSLVGADAILVTSQGRLGVDMTADGQFTASADAVLNPDQYLEATFLNDVQDRRRRILQKLFENKSWQASLDGPQLMVWLNDWDHWFQFGDGLQRQGDTLLMVPLELSRPPAGTDMTIPSPLLSFTNCRPPDGSSAAGFWDDRLRVWQERSRPSTNWLTIQIPQPLLPLTASQAQIKVDVSGAMGQIEILGVKNGDVVSLQTVTNPVGSLFFEIDDPEVLTVSENGELTLGIRAGVPAQSGNPQARPDSGSAGASPESPVLPAEGLGMTTPDNYWKIGSLSVQLQARVSELPEED